ncbi:MAG: hypothetical protein AAF389_11095 [Gemmatimonadota bacterium]
MNRRRALGLLGSGLVGVVGCSPPDRTPVRTSRRLDPTDVTSVASPWADGIVFVDVPEPADVVAYVSMETRRVYVDSSFRDRASWLLRAHISVSTWHWRIPLAGDDPSVPISPGDEAREFEELDLELWDPSMGPAMDDIRIVRGREADQRILATCTRLEGTTDRAVRASGGVVVRRAHAGESGTVREDFHILGLADLRASECLGTGEAVQLVGWGRREA